MAEVLGLAASVISVVSLAIQLGDSIKKACDFWEAIEDGPDDIKRISSDLRLLSNLIAVIRHGNDADTGRAQEQLVRSALENAKKDIDDLASLISDLQRALGPTKKGLKRKWGRVQVAMKGGKIVKLRGYVEGAKSSLNLLQALQTQSAVFQMNGRLEMLATTFTMARENYAIINQNDQQTMASTSRIGSSNGIIESSGEPRSTQIHTKTSFRRINAGLGVLSLASTATKLLNIKDADEEPKELGAKKTFVARFLWGFSSCRKGFRLSVDDTFDTFSFNTIRRRPTDSHIFRLCEKGDARGVRELLMVGEASVYDVDTGGFTPLHYACYFGHSELVTLLVDQKSDIYLRNDRGSAPMDNLRDYHENGGDDIPQRQAIARIVDTMIRQGNFEPFDWPDSIYSTETLSLYYGLPFENLQYLLTTEDIYATPEQRCDLILDNFLCLAGSIESISDSVDLLLTQYAKIRSYESGYAGWNYKITLLQSLIPSWIALPVGKRAAAKFQISRALKLTNDLWYSDGEGTPLDTIARFDSQKIPQWLEMISQSGVNLSEYIQYEHSQHLDGVIYQSQHLCCRIIYVDFEFGNTEEDISVKVRNICNPFFEHLDPGYRCELSRPRQICISQLDDAFVGADGKPLATLPGSWTTPLRPNKELSVVFSFINRGWQYVDFVEPGDTLWEDYMKGEGDKNEETEMSDSEEESSNTSDNESLHSETDTPEHKSPQDVQVETFLDSAQEPAASNESTP
ncbi:hypothetical protein LSUE1_G000619 [Lachnellula suecica]|uniref:Fungal N-terminal domain-containing protein n=1 Tax=Lachnellula suecica TaxID=602035 RepID=A0A8T9CKR8_9HELO|nr:hypothetical protein LSUE1_G000619 [Lachnellula suecica]